MFVCTLLVACAPTVEVKAPDKPIVINLNLKIEHEMRIKIEKDVDALLDQNSDIF
ncbi:MAG: YnbE family lipoprotein [Magnetococcales bacterium]|nr:YnbE family lipoprotein [Magnetococcales bacterium]